MSVHNKHAATEDEVGILHGAITKIFNKKAQAILDTIEEDPDAALHLVSGKDIGAMCKWVLDNGITATPAAQQEESKLSKRLKAIREASSGKIIQFTKRSDMHRWCESQGYTILPSGVILSKGGTPLKPFKAGRGYLAVKIKIKKVNGVMSMFIN